MQDLINKLTELIALRQQATPGPWVRWAEHPSVYAGPADINTPAHLSGVRAKVADCELSSDDLMSDFDEQQGPYDGVDNAAFIEAAGSFDFAGLLTALQAAPAAVPQRLDLYTLHARLLPLAQAAGHQQLLLSEHIGQLDGTAPYYEASCTGGPSGFRRYVDYFGYGSTPAHFEQALTEKLSEQQRFHKTHHAA